MEYHAPTESLSQTDDGKPYGVFGRNWGRRRRALNRTQAGIAIGQDGDARVLADAELSQHLRDRRRARHTALAYECGPCGRVAGATDLAHHDLERAGRPRVPIAYMPPSRPMTRSSPDVVG